MSHYVFTGTLRAYICRDCWSAVPNATVRLYYHRDNQVPGDLVAARSKNTFAEQSAKQVDDKRDFLIAEGTTSDDGSFTIEIDDDRYQGGSFEVDMELSTINGRKAEPRQYTITSIEPKWTTEGNQQVADWDYFVPARYWCNILAQWDWWVICGRVVAAGTNTGLDGMTVRAYDRDWLQDDLLGETTTNANGHFWVFYSATSYQETPFSPGINLELTGGPDVYFEVDDTNGVTVIDESPTAGRDPGRENIGRCFCVRLEVGSVRNPPLDPWFTHVGKFHILSDIDSGSGKANKGITVPGSSTVGGNGWGFFHHLKLIGFCPKVKQGTSDKMFYRFLYVDPDTSSENPIVGNLIVGELVGSKTVSWDINSDGTFTDTTQGIFIAGSGATPPVNNGTGSVPAHIINPNPNGWIAVDQNSLGGGFNGPLVKVNSNLIVPGGASPAAGAGNAPVTQSGKKVTFIYETTTDDGTGQPDVSAIVRQVDTVTLLVNNWGEVRQLSLKEFETGANGACTGLTNSLTIKYTVDHEFVRNWSLGMSSAATPWSAPALPNGSNIVAAEHKVEAPPPGEDVSTWPACSYVVSLSSTRSLTDGEHNDDGDTTLVTFCKI